MDNEEQIPIHSNGAAASLSLADAADQSDGIGISSFSDVPLDEGCCDGHTQGTDITTQEDPLSSTREAVRTVQIFLFCTLGVVFVIFIVFISVAVANRNNKESAPQDAVYDYLALQGISDRTALRTDNTPQNKAAQWIALYDRAHIPIPKVGIEDPENTSGYMFMVRYVMALNYFALNGERWTTQLNFLSGDDVCSWNGFSLSYSGGQYPGGKIGGLLCDKQSGLPIVFDLEYQGLKGPIPTETGLLTTLRALDLEYNIDMVGTIPTELCQLTNLKFLSLKNNSLTGVIPDCLGQCTDLRHLQLDLNQLTGSLPMNSGEFCNLKKLEAFIVQRNGLVGKVPDCIGDWTNLVTFIISDNAFTGELPSTLSSLTNLRHFWIDDNKFEGDPASILNELTSLILFYAGNNQFTGLVDEEFVKKLSKLTVLDISGNNFTSADHGIPSHLLQLPSLMILDLSRNALTGHIPRVIPVNTNLLFLAAHSNNLKGGIPTQLKNLKKLFHLDLSANQLRGTIPDEIFEMKSLRNLYLAENPGFTEGPIPSGLGSLTTLEELSLKHTNRNGSLPQLLGFDDLALLDLDNNFFAGNIPSNYGTLTSLRYLLLNRNKGIKGPMPEFLNTVPLQLVLVDGTSVRGNFSSICTLPTITGQKDLPGIELVVANCQRGGSPIQCECCHCCTNVSAPQESCSDPVVTSLDWTWESQFERVIHDFGVNLTILDTPVDQNF